MPCVGAAVVPHSPLFIPAIAKEHAGLGEVGRRSILHIGELLHHCGAEVLLVITPHAVSVQDQVVVLHGDPLSGDLKEFGDLTTSTFVGAPQVQQVLLDQLRTDGVSAALQSDAPIDYGTIVPLRLLGIETMPLVVVVSVGRASAEVCIRTGRALAEVAHNSPARLAFVASADLSRRQSSDVNQDRPTAFERQVARALRTQNVAEAPALTKKSVCGLAPILTLLGAFEGRSSHTEILATGAPYGVGFLTAWLES